MAATPDCEVCVYMDNIRPSCGFMSFRAGLSRVGVDALKAACEHRSGPTSVLGLQLRDQFINLLWESCLDSRKTEVPVVATVVETRRAKVVYSATDRQQVERANPKKQKTDIPPIDVNLTVEDIQVIQLPQDEEKTASKATVAELFEEVKRLRAENRKLSESQQQLVESQQQLVHKQAELVEIVQRLQSQQDVSGRLLCTVYDRQRSPVEQTLFTQQTGGSSC
ncbi:hypothetical protein PI124_g13349 [Phytophthora idaei]|nr:hypothetical protein PI125_g12822 [Phytophthora idaei]KAG3149705.1 hypothetical protein PI126_g11904 [Phytophthora idaei]KAG3241800.1 hypothetical protein PI124_g13349 [Phytophthora idaei]